MKFEKRFFFSVIPEWKDQYIQLEALMKQIEAIKNSALRLVQSVANIRKFEGVSGPQVDLHSIKSDKDFWKMLEDNLSRVQAFYETQLSSFLEQFHALTLQTILLNKMEEYTPFTAGQSTKLERELGRLPTHNTMPIGVVGVKNQGPRAGGYARFLRLDKTTNIEEVKSQLEAFKPRLDSKGRYIRDELDNMDMDHIHGDDALYTDSGSYNTPQNHPPGLNARNSHWQDPFGAAQSIASIHTVSINEHPFSHHHYPPQQQQPNMSIEDHLRDFHNASSQLESSRNDHPSFSNNPISDVDIADPNRRIPLRTSAEIKHDSLAPQPLQQLQTDSGIRRPKGSSDDDIDNGNHSEDSFFASSPDNSDHDMDDPNGNHIHVSSRDPLIVAGKSNAELIQSGQMIKIPRSTTSKPSPARRNIVVPQLAIPGSSSSQPSADHRGDWAHDDFFSDDEEGDGGPHNLKHPGYTTFDGDPLSLPVQQGEEAIFDLQALAEEDDSFGLMGTLADSIHLRGSAKHKRVPGFFDNDTSDDGMSHHASDDSGYSSGGSGDGFVDESFGHDDTDGHPTRRKKHHSHLDEEGEATASRIREVPETKLRGSHAMKKHHPEPHHHHISHSSKNSKAHPISSTAGKVPGTSESPSMSSGTESSNNGNNRIPLAVLQGEYPVNDNNEPLIGPSLIDSDDELSGLKSSQQALMDSNSRPSTSSASPDPIIAPIPTIMVSHSLSNIKTALQVVPPPISASASTTPVRSTSPFQTMSEIKAGSINSNDNDATKRPNPLNHLATTGEIILSATHHPELTSFHQKNVNNLTLSSSPSPDNSNSSKNKDFKATPIIPSSASSPIMKSALKSSKMGSGNKDSNFTENMTKSRSFVTIGDSTHIPSPPRHHDNDSSESNTVELDVLSGHGSLLGSNGIDPLHVAQAQNQSRNVSDLDTRIPLDLEKTEPPRTTFYKLPDLRQTDRTKAINELKDGFSELYRGLHLLKRFAELNVEAVDKVLAKYEKNISRGERSRYTHQNLLEYPFAKATELKGLINQTEYVYAQAFTGGHRTPAMQKLRVPDDEDDMEETTIRFGFLFGMSLGFALIIIYMCFVINASVIAKLRPDLIVYRMLFVVTLMFWYWGVDMYIWSMHRVNYPFIFEFNSRAHMRHQNIFDIASIFTVVLIGDMMIYMLTALQIYDNSFLVPGFEFLRSVPPDSYPLALVILLLGLSLFYSVKSGFWLLKVLFRIVTAPLHPVVFRDFFLGDQLVSMSLILQDIDFTICYFSISAFRGSGNECASNHQWMLPILSTLPQLWRLLQCFRRYYDSKDVFQLYNAGKYSTGCTVAIASGIRSIYPNNLWLGIWITFVIISTVYAYSWDILRDWSIGNIHSKHWMLRDQLLYPKWWYYVAAVANFVLRFMWTFTISPAMVSSFFLGGKDGFNTLLICLEVSRRAMWNIFRLENEQLNNCGKFRALQDIPLPLPLKPAVEDGLYHDSIKD